MAGTILCTGQVFLAAGDGWMGLGRAKVWEEGLGAGWTAVLQGFLGRLNPELWLKVVAASLGVMVEEAVCVMTDGGTVSVETLTCRGRGVGARAGPGPGGGAGGGGGGVMVTFAGVGIGSMGPEYWGT